MDPSTRLKNRLGGNTFYLPYVEDNGTKVIRELIFDANLSTLTWQDVEGGTKSGTSSLRLDGKYLVLDDNIMALNLDLYIDERQALNIYFSGRYYRGNHDLKLGRFKVFSSQEEVYSYLGSLLAGQTYYSPRLEENSIMEILFNEEMTRILRYTESNIEVFGDKLYIGENEVMTLRYASSGSLYFDYKGLDENNQTVYRQVTLHIDTANAQSELDDYNSQPRIYLSEKYINMFTGQDRNISYTTQNIDTVRLEGAPDFITLDTDNNSIKIDTSTLSYGQNFDIAVVGINDETGSEVRKYLSISITVDPTFILRNKLGGNTYYMPYIDKNETKIIRELTFDTNLSILTWQELEGSISGSSIITFDKKEGTLILDGEMRMSVYSGKESEPLSVSFFRNKTSSSKFSITREFIASFLEGSFKLFSSEEELHAYLFDILAGNTYFVPNFIENRIDEVLFNEEFTTITRLNTDSITAFGDRLYIGTSEVMKYTGWGYPERLYFDYEGLDENNETVYRQMTMCVDYANAQSTLAYYNSQPHINIPKKEIEMNIGELRTISYSTRNLENIHLRSEHDFVTIDTTNQIITIDSRGLTNEISIEVVISGDTTEGYGFGIIFFVHLVFNDTV